MEQRTPEWFAARIGRVTASRVSDVIAKTKTGVSASRANYLAELVADARLLQLDEARALESAMAVRDVLAIAELAYLAEVAVQQEKDAIAAFIMFMD